MGELAPHEFTGEVTKDEIGQEGRLNASEVLHVGLFGLGCVQPLEIPAMMRSTSSIYPGSNTSAWVL